MLVIGFVVLSCLSAVPPAQAATAAYTATVITPAPPAKPFTVIDPTSFSGWDVSMTPRALYRVYHARPRLTVACNLQATGAFCGPTRTVVDSSGTDFKSQGNSGTHIIEASGRLYTWGTRVLDASAGVVCIDTNLPDTTPNPFCGYTKMTGTGGAAVNGIYGTVSNPVQVGSKWYAFNYVAGAPSSSATGANTLLCFDFATLAACPASPISLGIAGTFQPPWGASYGAPAIAQIGGNIIISYITSAAAITCWDPATGAVCAGSWPVANARANGYRGAPFPVLDTAGATRGFCLATGNPADCYNVTGGALAIPFGLTSTLRENHRFNGPAVILGDRVYLANDVYSKVQCYDFGSAAPCPSFPRPITSIYTVNADPARPSCLWVVSNVGVGGSSAVTPMDAFTGKECDSGSIRVLASPVISPAAQCVPDSYTQLAILSPDRTTYTDGAVAFLDGNGAPITSIADRPIGADGTVDLTGLNLNTAAGLPQFLITLNHPTTTTPTAVTTELSWNGADAPECNPPAPPPAADLSLTKNVDVSTAAAGQTVTYTLTVHNAGPADSHDVTITDALPAGLTWSSSSPGCTGTTTVTCQLNTVPSGASRSVVIQATVTPPPPPPPPTTGPTDPTLTHQLDATKVEAHLSVVGPSTATQSATCPDGYLATDGTVRIDHVDGGTLSDVSVVSSAATPDGTGWAGTLTSTATGQVQAKVIVVCLTDHTTATQGHDHALTVSDPLLEFTTWSGPGAETQPLNCPAGEVAIAPSYTDLTGARVTSNEPTTTGWQFGVTAHGPGGGTFSIRCLRSTTANAAGHHHALRLIELEDTLTVDAGSGTESALTCADQAKGIVADYTSMALSLGTDPQPKTRLFRFHNPTSEELDAGIGLLCLEVRTGGATTNSPVTTPTEPTSVTVTNEARVTASTNDPSPGDNTATASFTATSGPAPVVLLARAATVTTTRAGDTVVSVRVRCNARCAFSARLLALANAGSRIHLGDVLARGRDRSRAGTTITVRLRATHGAGRLLRKDRIHRARLVVTLADGTRLSRNVRLR
ncbi:hypothetical protein NSZ01_03330 [Nocardioides szechwanensis]|nr:hypothetical protein NSZ01_03330 [Nocardioides szechwanensis]